ncbi:hypothetical protein [Photobacterium sp. OFAV2-7]|uniref:hypothetical protein n=1 Tax=Photobacterium sp. OFAV2-7 TaxID=2917748 RepID=UPI001EF5CCF1|nr:hypothetical protein [Photobacterium sp. OFAV2-7]MCG7585650.1 hypothetical protein [Photobacterium sp. OFAV2-7]
MELAEINKLEHQLSLPVGFFEALLTEDDWSFVIKLHALIEGAISHLLITHIDEPNLATTIAHLELSNTRTGKMAFVKSMTLLEKDSRRFITSLSELRNQLVHNISNISFSFKGLLSNYTEKEKDAFIKRFAIVQPPLNDKLRREMILHDPKKTIWFSAMTILLSVHYRNKTFALERYVKAHSIMFAPEEQSD